MNRTGRSLLVVGILAAALNLRPAAASVGPLLTRIRADTGLSAVAAGALTTLSVVCFGAFAPVAPGLARRLGTRAAIAGAMVVLTAGIALRMVPAVEFLFLGTVMAGAGIAVANVLLPVLVRGSLHEHTGLVTGAYTTALIGFAALAAIVWAPLARRNTAEEKDPEDERPARPDSTGDHGHLEGASDAMSRTSAANTSNGSSSARTMLRDPLAWTVTLFFGIQSAGFYASLAWLPSIFQSHGASESRAGLYLAASMIAGLAAALLLPNVAARSRDQRGLALGATALTAVGWIGILVAPMWAPLLWVAILGLGQNGTFPLVMTMIVLRGGTVANTARLSTQAQTVGYLIAALAPLGAGALHQVTGSWTPVVAALAALTLPQAFAGVSAGRDATVASGAAVARRARRLTPARSRTGRADRSS